VHVGVDATGKHIFSLGIDDVLCPDLIQSPMAGQRHDFLLLHGHVQRQDGIFIRDETIFDQ